MPKGLWRLLTHERYHRHWPWVSACSSALLGRSACRAPPRRHRGDVHEISGNPAYRGASSRRDLVLSPPSYRALSDAVAALSVPRRFRSCGTPEAEHLRALPSFARCSCSSPSAAGEAGAICISRGRLEGCPHHGTNYWIDRMPGTAVIARVPDAKSQRRCGQSGLTACGAKTLIRAVRPCNRTGSRGRL
jgi:hypothetical protein